MDVLVPYSLKYDIIQRELEKFCDIHRLACFMNYDKHGETRIKIESIKGDTVFYLGCWDLDYYDDPTIVIDSVKAILYRKVALLTNDRVDPNTLRELVRIDHAKPVEQRVSIKKLKPINRPEITKVIFNPPATIVFWNDGMKTVVKAQDGETFDPEKGLAMAISKRAFGNNGSYFNEIKKWTEEYETPLCNDITPLSDFEQVLQKAVAAANNLNKALRGEKSCQ